MLFKPPPRDLTSITGPYERCISLRHPFHCVKRFRYQRRANRYLARSCRWLISLVSAAALVGVVLSRAETCTESRILISLQSVQKYEPVSSRDNILPAVYSCDCEQRKVSEGDISPHISRPHLIGSSGLHKKDSIVLTHFRPPHSSFHISTHSEPHKVHTCLDFEVVKGTSLIQVQGRQRSHLILISRQRRRICMTP